MSEEKIIGRYCLNCKWLYPEGPLIGQCRRRSPTRDLEANAVWPHVRPNMTCGEHDIVDEATTAIRKEALITKINPIPEDGLNLDMEI